MKNVRSEFKNTSLSENLEVTLFHIIEICIIFYQKWKGIIESIFFSTSVKAHILIIPPETTTLKLISSQCSVTNYDHR